MVSRAFARQLEPLLFPIKLYKLVESNEVKSIQWSSKGTAIKLNIKSLKECFVAGIFQVTDHRHVFRQLSYYGFHRISKEGDVWEFQHPNFRADRFDLVQTIRRARKKDKISDFKVVLPFIERRKSARLQTKGIKTKDDVKSFSSEDSDFSEERGLGSDVETYCKRSTRIKRKNNYIGRNSKQNAGPVVQRLSRDTSVSRDTKGGKNLNVLKSYSCLRNDSKPALKNRKNRIKDEAWIENNIQFAKGSNAKNVKNEDPSHHATLHNDKNLAESKRDSIRQKLQLNRSHYTDHDYIRALSPTDVIEDSPFCESKYEIKESVYSEDKVKNRSNCLENSSDCEVTLSGARIIDAKEKREGRRQENAALNDKVINAGLNDSVINAGLNDNVINANKALIPNKNKATSSQNDQEMTLTENLGIRIKVENFDPDDIPKNDWKKNRLQSRIGKSFVLGSGYRWVPVDTDSEQKSLENSQNFAEKDTLHNKDVEIYILEKDPVTCSRELPVDTPTPVKTVSSNISSLRESTFSACINSQKQAIEGSEQCENIGTASNSRPVKVSTLPHFSGNMSFSICSSPNTGETLVNKKVDPVVSCQNYTPSQFNRSVESSVAQTQNLHSKLSRSPNNEIVRDKGVNMSDIYRAISESYSPAQGNVASNNSNNTAIRPATASKAKDINKSKREFLISKKSSKSNGINKAKRKFCISKKSSKKFKRLCKFANLDQSSTSSKSRIPCSRIVPANFSQEVVAEQNVSSRSVDGQSEVHSSAHSDKPRSSSQKRFPQPTSDTRYLNNARSPICAATTSEIKFETVPICLSPEERQAVVKFLHLEVKNGNMHTWDILESTNPVIIDCAYDALTYDVQQALSSR